MSVNEEGQSEHVFNFLEKFNKISDRLLKQIDLLDISDENSNDDVACNSYIYENYMTGCDDPEYLNFIEKLLNDPLTEKMNFLSVLHDDDEYDVAGANITCSTIGCIGKNAFDDVDDDEDDPKLIEILAKYKYASHKLQVDDLIANGVVSIDDTIADKLDFVKCYENFHNATDRLARTINLLNSISEDVDDELEEYFTGEDDDGIIANDNDLLQFIEKFSIVSNRLTNQIDVLNVCADKSNDDAAKANAKEKETGDITNNEDEKFYDFVEKFNYASGCFTAQIGHGEGEGEASKIKKNKM